MGKGAETRRTAIEGYRAGGLLFCLLVLSMGCRDHEPEPLTFRYHLSSAPRTLDPAWGRDSFSLGVADRIFDGLMRLDRTRQVPEPEIAESYTVSKDGLVYEFRLRRDVRFHNGRLVLASDFKYSWERLLATETSGKQAWLLEAIEGAEAFRAGESESVSGVEATDPDLLRIRLTEPLVPFLYHLTDPALSVVPREEVERLGERFGRQPVGSGPYRFVEAVRDFRIVLMAFSDHARHRPQVKRLVYEVVPNEAEALRLFRADRLDMVTRLPPGSDQELQRSLSANLRIFPGLSGGQGFCFRCDQAPFDDPRVRRAFALAIDRDALVRELGELRYTASTGFLPWIITGHNPDNLARGYAPERARALLAEAGYAGGVSFPMAVYTTSTGERYEQVAKALLADLAALGVSGEYRAMAFGSLLEEAEDGRLPFFRKSWQGEYPDPEPYLRPLFHSRGSYNDYAYANPEVDRLLDTARTEPDSEHRRALYRQAEALIIHDAPCVALYHDTVVILLATRWQHIPLGVGSSYLEIELARLTKENR